MEFRYQTRRWIWSIRKAPVGAKRWSFAGDGDDVVEQRHCAGLVEKWDFHDKIGGGFAAFLGALSPMLPDARDGINRTINGFRQAETPCLGTSVREKSEVISRQGVFGW